MDCGPCPKSRANKPASCCCCYCCCCCCCCWILCSSLQTSSAQQACSTSTRDTELPSTPAETRGHEVKRNGSLQSSFKNKKKGRGGMQRGCRRTSTSTTQKHSKTKLLALEGVLPVNMMSDTMLTVKKNHTFSKSVTITRGARQDREETIIAMIAACSPISPTLKKATMHNRDLCMFYSCL